MLNDLDGCFSEDLIFFGLFASISVLAGSSVFRCVLGLSLFLDDFGLRLSDLLALCGLAFLEWFGLDSFLERDSCFLCGDRLGDFDLVVVVRESCISASTVLVFVSLPRSST